MIITTSFGKRKFRYHWIFNYEHRFLNKHFKSELCGYFYGVDVLNANTIVYLTSNSPIAIMNRVNVIREQPVR